MAINRPEYRAAGYPHLLHPGLQHPHGARLGIGPVGNTDLANESIILLACTQLLKEESIPTANSREGLAKLISGWFNHIPKRADNILREHIRKSQAQRALTEQVDSKASKDSGENYKLQRNVKKAFREECHPEEDWILLAEIKATPTITPEERQVIDLTIEGFTQQDMAEKMGVSQPRINQLKSSAIKKIQMAQSEK